MKLFRGFKHLLDFEKGVVATIGNFDGVHLGHQHLIKTLKIKAQELQLPLVLILFEPQPQEYFLQTKAPTRISSLREKLDALKACHVDCIVCIKFDDELAQTSAYDFAKSYLFSNLRVKHLLVGADFRFGNNREGTIALLQELGSNHGCQVEVIPDFQMANEKISSTKIRKILAQGDLNSAALYLGRPYSVCGRVIYGDGRGRQWGIPTANLSLNRPSLPLHGVFAVEVRVQAKTIQGLANIGIRPTVDGTRNSLEVHLLDFDESIYGASMQVFFLHKLRDEVKFTQIQELIHQIHQDITATRAFFATWNCEHNKTAVTHFKENTYD